MLVAAGLAGGAAAAFAMATHAQDAGPQASGGLVPTGGLHDAIAAAFAAAAGGPPAPPSTAPAWVITPALTLKQEWTNNALQQTGQAGGSGGKRASFITVVSPSLSISGATSRITANVVYAPELYHYSSVSGQDRIGQNLDATALVTLVPDQLFVDLRGFAAQQSLNGASGPAGTTALSRQNAVQSYDVSVTPYLDHRFGGWGTARVGATVSETTQGAFGGSLPGSAQYGTQSDQTVTTRKAFATFASGENFGRLLGTLDLSASQSSGSGALQGAHRNLATYQAGYAITRSVTALASVGWEDIQYGGPDPLRVNDATWSVGARLTPNADSSITVQYGHQDGATAASLDASYAATARTHLYAHYSDGLSTDTEQLQNALSHAQLDAMGNPVNAQTGAPLLLTDNFFGVTSSVYRIRSASLTASWLRDREAVQATVNHQEQTPVGRAGAGTLVAASRGTYGSLAWEHDMSEALRSNLYGQYGKLSQTSGGASLDTTVVVATGAMTYQFSETLSGSLEYSYTSDSYAAQSSGTAASLVALGVRKTF